MATRVTPLQKKIRAYARKVSKIQPKIDAEMRKVLNRNHFFLAELNRSQLVEGLNEEGQPIGNTKPYRSQEYANYKNELNPLPGIGNPDLRLTGDYWDSIQAIVKGREIQMIATDAKADDLSEYRGIGIAPQNYPEIANLLRNQIKLEI